MKIKGQNEINKFSALEYIRSNKAYLDNENERKNFYIHKTYHNQIDTINFKHIIIVNIGTLLNVRIGFLNNFYSLYIL